MNENKIDRDKAPLADPIARGRTADIYNWDEGHILKLFHDWFDIEDIEYEMRIARAVRASGVKSPAVRERVRVGGRNGLIYERAAGESMESLFPRRPWKLFIYARLLARLHVQIHENGFDPDLPSQHARLENKINRADALPASLKASLLDALHSLPDGGCVCHGDFHPANVLLSESGATVIDWIDATRGNPLADVARTSIIALGAANHAPPSNPLAGTFLKVFHAAYLKQYFSLRPGGKDEYRRWLPIVAGARLSEGIRDLEPWLTVQAQKVK